MVRQSRRWPAWMGIRPLFGLGDRHDPESMSPFSLMPSGTVLTRSRAKCRCSPAQEE